VNNAETWPTEIRLLTAEKALEIDFDDGTTFRLPAELLRVETPSAEAKGHGGALRQIVAGKRHVGIREIETIGNYAIRILFDDGHNTGIYSWRALRALGEDQDAIWRLYLDSLAEKGLTR
jgi:DUF971 family protein